MFAELDTDNDGLIDAEAFSKGLAAAGAELSESDVKEFMQVCQVSAREGELKMEQGRIRGAAS
jgi:Ca2+-binding EF-hand superfamily protein